jgi:hypothetical protein
MITVAQMMEALSKLPADAKLVITESGYYSCQEFAKIMLPQAYIVEDGGEGVSRREQVYRIGHSHQSY